MNNSFLYEVVRSLSNPNWEELCFIVPNKRSALHLTQAITAQLESPTIAPEIIDIDSFIRNLSRLEAPPKMEQLFALYNSYCQVVDSKERDNFMTFLGWGDTLLGDLDAIDRNLLQRKEVFGLLAGMQEIKAWGSDDNAFVQRYLSFWKALPKMYDSFSSALLEKGHGTTGMLCREAVRNLEVFLEAQPKTSFLICGFNALTESESTLFQSILAQNRGKIYWDADTYFLQNPQEQSGQYLNSYKNWPYYENQPFLGSHNTFLNQKEIEVIETSGRIAQAKQVGSILKDLSTTKLGWERVAVVLPDESLLNPILHALPPEVNKLNITMGQPLQQQPITVVIEALFDLHMNQTQKGFYYKSIVQIFTHESIRTYCEKNELKDPKEFAQSIISGNQRFLTVNHLKKANLFKDFGFLFSPWNNPIEAVQSICKLLQLLLTTADPDDNQQLESIHLFLTLFHQLDLQLRTHPFIKQISELRTIYNAQIGTHKLSYSGEPLEGLQIMGMLETRLLDFDTVILTQVNEGILPAKSIDDSWIPYDMKKQFGLPTRDEKNAIFSYHFFRLMYRAKKVYILYDGQGDGLGGGEMSRFVRQWATQLPENHSMRFFNQRVTLNTVTRQRHEILKTPSLIKRLQEMAKKGLSATALSNYIADPIRFYNNYVLRISENEELEESIAYQTLGTVIHNTLEELYTPYVAKQLTVQNIKKMQDTHKQTLQKHFEDELGKSSHTTGKNLLLFTAAAHSIRRVLEADKNDILEGSTIELLGLEEYRKVTRTYAGVEHPITFHGVIDRIDRKDGVLRILDYKTGQTNNKELRPSEISDCLSDSVYGKSFQVLFYSMLWAEYDPKNPFYAGVISVKNMSSGTMFLGFGTGRTKRTELITEDLENFEKELEKLVIEIYHSDIAFTEAI
jgi:hypothetical protein